MQTSNNSAPISSDSLFKLCVEENILQGKLDAFELAFKYKGDVLKIREAVILFKRGEFSRLDISKTRSDKYREGFLKGLEDTLPLIDKAINKTDPFHPSRIYQTRAEFELGWYSTTLSGKHDAYEFAISCQGNLTKIKMEIEDAKTIIEEYEVTGRKNTSLMKYKQGYLEGLFEALKIIEA